MFISPESRRILKLIAEAKQRQEERRVRELQAFQDSLESTLSKELCDLLHMDYELKEVGQPPRGIFRIGEWTWTLSPNPIVDAERPWKWGLDIRNAGGANRGGVIDTMDDLLLRIDRETPSPV